MIKIQKLKKLRIVFLINLIILLSAFYISNLDANRMNDYEDIFQDYSIENNLKKAGFWNLTGNPILIDDIDPSKNWSYTASHYDWCSGSGIWTDPYVIENVTIDGQNEGNCIEIKNSNAYFVINNCTAYSSGTTNYGIYLNYTNNGRIINNNCSVYYGGIFLDRSNNITVLGNDMSNNQYGIAVSFSNNTIISGNSANNNTGSDIVLQWSRNATLTENTLTSGGNPLNFGGVFLYYSSSQEDLASYTIDTTNLINGKPIYYYANEKGLRPNDFLNAGQIILVNCSDSLISNVNITGVYLGISIMYGNNNTISDNFLENNFIGIMISTLTDNNVISRNIMKNCYYGIALSYDRHTIISRNVIEKSYYGISISSMYNSSVSENIVSNSEIGIMMGNSNNTKISKNSVENNNRGIYLSSSKENVVSRNIIRNNKEYGVYILESVDPPPSTQNLFFQNSFLNNSIHAYDEGGNNNWNNSIIGNYWDNYTGIDSNDDGIGDTPHTFNNGTDYLPIVDTTAPTIIINTPISLEVFVESSPDFNVEITDVLLDKIWYTLDNGATNFTFTSNGTINQAAWISLLEGNVDLRFYANDSLGRIGFAEVSIKKNVNAPVITINNPQNSNVFGATTPNFDISIDELNLDKMWYSLNGGNNITFTGLTGTINQALWDALPEGNVIIRFYANDTLGRTGVQEVTVVKEISHSNPPEIPGYNTILLLGIVSTIAVIILKKRLNHLN